MHRAAQALPVTRQHRLTEYSSNTSIVFYPRAERYIHYIREIWVQGSVDAVAGLMRVKVAIMYFGWKEGLPVHSSQ